ncbi:MAG TPA: thioredoxin fold domain-containing protein [Chitinophagaceae bacterium]
MKLLFTLILSFATGAVFSQASRPEPAYKRFPTLPPVDLLLGDSATWYKKAAIPKKKPVFLMLFSPDCSHCQQTAEELIAHKEELKDLHIIMATMHPLTQMNDFVRKYGLGQLPNLTVGKDVYYTLSGFYEIKHLPYMAFYNKKGDLISVFEGGLPIPKVLGIFKDHK